MWDKKFNGINIMKTTKKVKDNGTLLCNQTITFYLKSGGAFIIKSYGDIVTQELQRSFAQCVRGESGAPQSFEQVIISDGSGNGTHQLVQVPFSQLAAITYVEDKPQRQQR